MTGLVKEFNGLTEISKVHSFMLLSSDNDLKPCIVTLHQCAQESYESVLVKIVNTTVVSLNSDGEWTIADASDSMRCGDKNDYVYFPQISDSLITIQGIVWYENLCYKLQPRFTMDIHWQDIWHYALYGDVVTMNAESEVLADAYLEIRGDRIQSISFDSPTDVDVYSVNGFIFPGLIDAHNHPQWDVLDKITFDTTFTDRYEWQESEVYRQAYNQFTDILNYGGDDAQLINLMKIAEVRAMCAGTTTIQGSNRSATEYDDFAHQGIGINNAERFPARIYYDVFPLTRGVDFWQQQNNTYWRRFVIHLAEGSNQAVLQEFYDWQAMNMLDSRTVVIHGIPLGNDEFIRMAEAAAHLVWSPSSNWLLYKTTVDIPTALDMGVNIALAPDWTETGSPDLLSELQFAQGFNNQLWGGKLSPEQLAAFVTRNAAYALGLNDRIGAISPGMQADLMIIPKSHADPYKSLLSTTPADVQLTIVNGRPMVGDSALMARFRFVESADDIVIAGRDKKIALSIRSHNIDQSDKALSEIMAQLTDAYDSSDPKICRFLPYDVGYPVHVVQSAEKQMPEQWRLLQNYPNPFNAATLIGYFVPRNSRVTLEIYDCTGRMVATLAAGSEKAGYQSVEWNADGLASGLYFYRLYVPDSRGPSPVRKMVYVK